MITREASATTAQTLSASSPEKGPELSLQEIAALLNGRLPASKVNSCLDQIPFLPARNRVSAN